MALPEGFLDDLRNRLELSEIVGRHVALKRKGREWAACCPFHKEKTPSFYVNDEKDFYHCFGCGKHGDHISFLREHKGLSFMDAVRELADLAGLQVPDVSPQEAQRAEAKKSLKEVMELVAKFYEVCLRGPVGEQARSYLAARNIRAETVQKFRLGYAPARQLKDAMAQRGVTMEALVALGLFRQYDDKPEPLEVFRDRLMFPITDRSGQVVAFGGRLLSAGEPKYLNSPETDLFSKGRLLYGLAQARQAAYDNKDIVVAEGYMDVIALAQSGLPYAVAPLGTAVTQDQLRLLWKMVPGPTFALDGDRAGRGAARRAMERALPLLQPGLTLKFAWLPEGEDPDSLVKQKGLGALMPLLKRATPLSDFLWDQHFDPPPASPEERAGAWRDLGRALSQISDATVRASFAAEYEQRFEQAFGIRQAALMSEAEKAKDRTGAKARVGRWRSKYIPQYQGRLARPLAGMAGIEALDLDRSTDLSAGLMRQTKEGILLTLMLHAPEIALEVISEPGDMALSDPEANRLFQQLFLCALRLPSLDKTNVETHLADTGLGPVVARYSTHQRRLSAGISEATPPDDTYRAMLAAVWHTLNAPAPRARPTLR